MNVIVKLFAAARDAMAQSEVVLEIEDHATVKELRAKLAEQFPPLQPLLLHCLFAVDAQYVPDNTSLGENNEIALIPPVSGG